MMRYDFTHIGLPPPDSTFYIPNDVTKVIMYHSCLVPHLESREIHNHVHALQERHTF
jgi:hypothetical protein